MDSQHIRNFAIIAHIDHGKSTLADRLLELTGSLTAREMQAQVLDSMDLERERGITIKAHAVRMMYTAHDGQTYQLNLIDTPGHVDFSYEVSRSLASCEGALLVVDASQGVEAQTLANSYLAINHGLEIIPVINKIDLQSADIPRTKEMIEGAVGLDASDAVLISAKTGQGVPDVLEAIVKRVPPPKGNPDNRLQALVFDSWFDRLPRRGRAHPRISGHAAQRTKNSPHVERHHLRRGDARRAHSQAGGDRPTCRRAKSASSSPTSRMSPTRKSATPSPTTAIPPSNLCPALKRSSPWSSPGSTPSMLTSTPNCARPSKNLRLNDSSFFFEPESSVALGFGFRCGFLGLLHMEIIQERLEREFNLDLITTAPGVRYKITRPTARWSKSTIPRAGPIPARSPKSKSRSSSPRFSPMKNMSAEFSRWSKKSAASRKPSSTSAPRA